MLPNHPVEELHDAYAVTQLHHEMKIIGIVRSLDEAKELSKKTANLGYPSFVIPVPVAYVQRGTIYAQPNYK